MSYDDGSLDRRGEEVPPSAPGKPRGRRGAGSAVVSGLLFVLGRLRAHVEHWPQRHVEQQVKLYGDEK